MRFTMLLLLLFGLCMASGCGGGSGELSDEIKNDPNFHSDADPRTYNGRGDED